MWTSSNWFGLNRTTINEAKDDKSTDTGDVNDVVDESVFDDVNKAIQKQHTADLAKKAKADSVKKVDHVNHQIQKMHSAVSKHVADFNKKNEDVSESNEAEHPAAKEVSRRFDKTGQGTSTYKAANGTRYEINGHRGKYSAGVSSHTSVSGLLHKIDARIARAARNEDVELDEQIKGWKNAGSDLAKMRAAKGKDVKLVRLKKDGGESRIKTDTKMFRSEADAHEHHNRLTELNPKSKIGHNLYIDGKHVAQLGESTEVNESALDSLFEGTVSHGHFSLTSSAKQTGKRVAEGRPTSVHAPQHHMGKLGVPVHHDDDYGDTVKVTVTNKTTGDKTTHHVYQRGLSDPRKQDGHRIVSVRSAGPQHPKSEIHNEVIKNYLSGHPYSHIHEQVVEDTVVSNLVEEALAAKRRTTP